MKKIAAILFILFLPAIIYAQDARVVTFSHTVRWETESGFPNYFQVSPVRDSIFNDIKQDLKAMLNVTEIALPENVAYHFIPGFRKMKNAASPASPSSGITIDISSVLGRTGWNNNVTWSVNVVIRKENQVIPTKAVSHEIENANAAAYLQEVRWLSPQQFRDIFHSLIRESAGLENAYAGKIIVNAPEERDKEVLSWFPNSTRYLLKSNGAIQAGNFAACLVNGNDTVTNFFYKDKLKSRQPISLKPAFSGLFTDITGVGMDYSVVQNQQLRRTVVFPKGQEIMIQMKWNQKVTASTVSDDVKVQPTETLIGQIFEDTTSVGNFTYERITQVLSTGAAKEKLTSLEEKNDAVSLGTAVIHSVKGTIGSRKFTAEYNQLFGISEIKIDNETCASMIFQNCNPSNLNSFNRIKLSDKKFMKGMSSASGTPSLTNESKQEWYPVFIKENSANEEIVTNLQILTCLFFGMGNM